MPCACLACWHWLLHAILVLPTFLSISGDNDNTRADMSIHAELSSGSPLRATVGVTSLLPLPPGVQGPLLQGQNQASAFPNGTISINDLSLIAVPGDYNVSVTLPDFDQVSTN